MATKEGDILLVTKDQVYTKAECLGTATTEMLGECASPDIALSKLAVRSNPNLLDNWYFGNPVNQKREKTYTQGYGIDRWSVGSGSMTVNEKSVTFTGANEVGIVQQPLSEEVEAYVRGKTVTLSILRADGTLLSGTTVVPASGNVDTGPVGDTATPYFDLYSYTSYHGALTVRSVIAGVDKSIELLAVKLEIGSVQTLAHKVGDKWELNEIPDYGLEFLKCCRYQYAPASSYGSQGYIGPFWTNGGSRDDSTPIYGTVTLPVPMRKQPTAVYTPEGPASILHWNPGGVSGTVSSLYVCGMTNGDIQLCATIAAALSPGPAGYLYFSNPTESLLLFDANL